MLRLLLLAGLLSVVARAGTITSVKPNSTSTASRDVEVTISGVGLGDGQDIVSVSLAGVAAQILSQSMDSVRVKAGPAARSCHGDVVVVSESEGTTVLAGGFSYIEAPPEPCDCPNPPQGLAAVKTSLALKANAATVLKEGWQEQLRTDLAAALGTRPYRFDVLSVSPAAADGSLSVELNVLPPFHGDSTTPSAYQLFVQLQSIVRQRSPELLSRPAAFWIDAARPLQGTGLRDCGKGRYLPTCPPHVPTSYLEEDRHMNGLFIGMWTTLWAILILGLILLWRKERRGKARRASASTALLSSNTSVSLNRQ